MQRYLFVMLLPLWFFASCASLIPGAREAEIQNIYNEYYSIAQIYKNEGNYTKAIEFYTKVLRNDELSNSAFYEIALCNVYLGNWDEARASFETLLEKDPDNTTLKLSLAYIEAVSGNLEGAEVLYKELCGDPPENVDALKNLINVLAAEGKYDEASERLSVLEENFPDEEGIAELKLKIEEALTPQEFENPEEESESILQDAVTTSPVNEN